MQEHSFISQLKKSKQYNTPDPLRKFIYQKAVKYNMEYNSIFDGAIGSGQLLQYFYDNNKSLKIYGFDVNGEAVEAALKNFENANIKNESFFNCEAKENSFDLCISNYPFSLKPSILTEPQYKNILNDLTLSKFYKNKKITGNLDFLFITKMFLLSKRYSMFFCFAGIAYRTIEKSFREFLNDYVLEIGMLENSNFESTNIPILFLLLDKQKNKDTKAKRFYFDCKDNKLISSDESLLNPSYWELPQKENDTVTPKIDIEKLNQEIKEIRKRRMELEQEIDDLIANEFS
jgi:type I restriction-modification system DNA methylase subunit